MTSFGRGDADLHRSDGSHISTPPTANGPMASEQSERANQVELYLNRLEAHLASHALDRRWPLPDLNPDVDPDIEA